VSAPLLELEQVRLAVPAGRALRELLCGVSLTIAPGEAVGLVGESGSGKSMTARTIVRMLPRGARVHGAVRLGGRDVLALDGRALRALRAQDVAIVFQDPRAHMNPVRTIGDFLTEALVHVRDVPREQAERRVLGLLRETGIRDPERRLRQYPHELSGGLLQRVAIAAALAAEPRLVIADEPTTALDVTTQSDVMAVLDELRAERGLALLFITHDLDLAAAVCDRTAVMYAGRIVEDRASARLQEDPLHPYSAALIASRPAVEGASGRLAAIGGRPAAAWEAPAGCAFADRCPHVEPACRAAEPPLAPLDGSLVRCRRAAELRGRLLTREGASRV
jgi:oligopeptide/dipeptide ABC transporter ATP-binding protein